MEEDYQEATSPKQNIKEVILVPSSSDPSTKEDDKEEEDENQFQQVPDTDSCETIPVNC